MICVSQTVSLDTLKLELYVNYIVIKLEENHGLKLCLLTSEVNSSLRSSSTSENRAERSMVRIIIIL